MPCVARVLVGSALLAVMTESGCLGGSSDPEAPGEGRRGAATSVDPEFCGNYAASAAGAKLKHFLEATVILNRTVAEMEAEVKMSCSSMTQQLGVSAVGDTKSMCNAVADGVRANLQAGVKDKAGLTLDYQPAVCTVDARMAAEAAARCEASASADVNVKCTGHCRGTCNGACRGQCAGDAAGGDGKRECAGQCEGTCEGSCAGPCEGSADVQASAECEAKAEVAANLGAECTEPVVAVEYDAEVVVDKRKVEAVVQALKSGLPKLVMISAKLRGPGGLAVKTWARTARNLAQSSGKLTSSLGDQSSCVAGQLRAAAAMVTKVEASVSVSVEASALVSGAAAASGA